jgi:glutathione S-transferase
LEKLILAQKLSRIGDWGGSNLDANSLQSGSVLDAIQHRQVQAWLRSDLLALRIERPTEVIFSKTTDQPLSASAAESVQKLYKVAEALLRSANINIFDSWSIADVDFSLMLNRLVANGDDVPEYLVKYVRHHWQHSAIQEWVSYSKDSS